MFSLQKLQVYDRALGSVTGLAQLASSWDKRHAVVDQLLRASESVVLNIAEGARLRNSPHRQHLVDYALGSALECAACLDIAQLKHWVVSPEILPHKQGLCEVVKMLYGLRRSWAAAEFREESGGYDAQEPWLFAHERLQAYQYALQVVGWYNAPAWRCRAFDPLVSADGQSGHKRGPQHRGRKWAAN
jgi:four helix bundle protein